MGVLIIILVIGLMFSIWHLTNTIYETADKVDKLYDLEDDWNEDYTLYLQNKKKYFKKLDKLYNP